MTDKQALKRWMFRHDYLENRLAVLYSRWRGCAYNLALEELREECEAALKDAGFNYPFDPKDE